MDELTTSERDSLAKVMSERKKPLREEIRRGLARMGSEGHADLLSGTADAGDESVAMLLSDLANAEVARDYPTAKRCLACQQIREATRAPARSA